MVLWFAVAHAAPPVYPFSVKPKPVKDVEAALVGTWWMFPASEPNMTAWVAAMTQLPAADADGLGLDVSLRKWIEDERAKGTVAPDGTQLGVDTTFGADGTFLSVLRGSTGEVGGTFRTSSPGKGTLKIEVQPQDFPSTVMDLRFVDRDHVLLTEEDGALTGAVRIR